MSKQLPKRSEVELKYTWDLSRLFPTEAAYEQAFLEVGNQIDGFAKAYQGKLNNAKTINEALDAFRPIQEQMMRVGSYANLYSSADSTDETNTIRSAKLQIGFGKWRNQLAFLSSEIKENDAKLLTEASKENKENELYLKEIIKDKKHSLSKEVEIALTQFSQSLGAPYANYQRFKLADMKFPDFEVNGKTYPSSFTLFENEWEYDADHDVRRAAYQSFYDVLAQYQNGLASNYQAEVLKQKATATLRGFDSVIDYLLYDQDVTRDMYDRQIDLIMEHLAPAMQKYAKLLKEVHGLDQMTYADLKISLDPEFEPAVTVEDSRKYILDGLRILGDDYLEMVNRSFDERWTDFSQNIGKSTGGFCSTPYGSNSFILLNWNNQMNEVFVLAHELGHAGHFYFAHQNQNIYNSRPSLYFIEAPSTMNELLLANHLTKEAKELRFKRWVYANTIARTYYHNFVTHLLEAAYQREVYLRVDRHQPLSAQVLNQLKLEVLRKFWGDAVEVPDYAGLTWIRQPHYFMGLYPYTYSAGLTVATATSKKLLNNEVKIEQWKEVLKAGGTKSPLELAKIVDVDLSTKQPLLDTIDYISSIIDQLVVLTKKLKK